MFSTWTGPAARQYRDQIVADRKLVPVRLTREPKIGSRIDAPLGSMADCLHRLAKAVARLDLHDRDHVASARNQINLAEPRLVAPRLNSIALEHESDGSHPFAAMTTPIGGKLPVSPVSSRHL